MTAVVVFGKYAGKHWHEVPKAYLQWLIKENLHRSEASNELHRRKLQG